MRGYGYEPGPGWFPDTRQELENAKTKAAENAPRVVLGQIAIILAIALGFALVVNLILFNFDIG